MSDYARMTRRLLLHYRTAQPEHLAAGLCWYEEALSRVSDTAAEYGYTPVQAAVALAHLSPRVGWQMNLQLLAYLLSGAEQPPWAMTRSWIQAQASLHAEDPMLTFGRRAKKTRAFAGAILGDRQSVVVDIWMARAAGVPEDSVRTVGGYHAVADACRRGAGRVGLAPRELQACVWVAIRGQAK